METDRISEVYYGKFMSPQSQTEAKERIAWICQQVRGTDVLDIGCSQGILSILLARQGKKVTGIDINPDGIKYARNSLIQENAITRENVTFIQGDALKQPFSDNSFDTVILGQLIEHVPEPEIFLDLARRLCKPEGRVIITTPFGIKDNLESIRTFYPAGFLKLISAFFTLSELSVTGKCIVFHGKPLKTPSTEELKPMAGISPEWIYKIQYLTESEYYQREKDDYIKLIEQSGRIDNLQAGYDALSIKYHALQLMNEQSKNLNESFQTLPGKIEDERQSTRKQILQLESEKQELQSRLTKLQDDIQGLSKELTELKHKKQVYKEKSQKLEEMLEKVRNKVNLNQAKYAERLSLIRSSPRFKIGDTFAKAYENPRKLLLLPLKLWRIYSGYKQEKRTGIKTVPFAPVNQASGPNSSASAQSAGLALINQETKSPAAGAPKAAILKTIRDRISELKKENRTISPMNSPVGKGLKIAVIMDEFTYDCFKYEAELITFTPQNWKNVLIEQKPDLLFVESAWRGNQSSWRYQVVNLSEKRQSQLPELVKWCRSNNIPTLFWNKEDPPHYEKFLEAAKLFDYVFTIDLERLPSYQKDLGHSRVFCLPFAAQPRIHNPVGSQPKIRDLAFAGSWHSSGGEDKQHRREQMATILTPALAFDVDIYDRNFSLDDDRYRYPEIYQKCIVGELPYDEMVYAYKLYNIFLNVSSESDSPTFLPRRVFEILASGACVLSGYSQGLKNLLGTEIVPVSNSSSETGSLLKKLLNDEEMRDRLVQRGRRLIMRNHTYRNRLNFILETMRLGHKMSAAGDKGVTIITSTNKPDNMRNIFANYDRQTIKNKEMIVILNNNQLNLDAWQAEAAGHPHVSVYRVDESLGLGVCLNFAIDHAGLDYLAKFDDDDYYAPCYLEDALDAFDFSGADIVGKRSYYLWLESSKTLAARFPGNEHCFCDLVAGATLVIKRDVFKKVKFASGKDHGKDTQFLRECSKNGFRIYSSDRFNFLGYRRASQDLHTWKISDEEILASSRPVAVQEDPLSFVTV